MILKKENFTTSLDNNVLSDSEKRKLYDQFGHSAFDGSMGSGGNPYENPGANYREFHFEGGDADYIFEDIFGNLFRGGHSAFDGSMGSGGNPYENPGANYREFHFEGGDADYIFEDIFGNLFRGEFHGSGFAGQGFENDFGNGRFYRRNYPEKGSDIEASLKIGFDEAAFGGERIVTLRDETGHTQSLKVRIPAGIDTGKAIRLRGKGRAGKNGGENRGIRNL